MILTFRPIDRWPDGWPRPPRQDSPFKSTYGSTLDLLDRELDALHAKEAFLQVDVRAGGVRLDGQLRADAAADNQGVILTIETKRRGTQVYSCDRFGNVYYGRGAGQQAWQHNLRAIALGLEALRKVERYGIAERGEQYAGYRALGAGIEVGPVAMTADEAAILIAEWAGIPANGGDPVGCADKMLAGDKALVERLAKAAAKRLHPDAGGDPAEFRQLQQAKALLT
jgi:hypothetical protein